MMRENEGAARPAPIRQSAPTRSTWIAASLLASVPVLIAGIAGGDQLRDLEVYRLAGTRLLDGLRLYEPDEQGLPFTYPPFAAILMVPVALIPLGVAKVAWTVGCMVCLAAIVARSLPQGSIPAWSALVGAAIMASAVAPRDVSGWMVWPGVVLVCLAAAASWWSSGRAAQVGLLGALLLVAAVLEPVQRSLHFGQVNLVLCALVLLDIGRRSGPLRGVGVGLASGIKLTPLFFLAFLVVTRQWAALRNAVVTFAGTVLVGFLVAPGDSLRYWTNAMRDTERIGVRFSFTNQSINGVLSRLEVPSGLIPPLWAVISTFVGVVVLILARHFWENGRAVTALSICGIAMAYIAPFSWSHHWVWALPLGLSLLAARHGSSRFPVDPVPLAFLAVFGAFVIWWPDHREDTELRWTMTQALLGNAYLIAGGALLVYLWWRVRPLRRVTASGRDAEQAQLNRDPDIA